VDVAEMFLPGVMSLFVVALLVTEVKILKKQIQIIQTLVAATRRCNKLRQQTMLLMLGLCALLVDS
jgi:hypothetical protein